MLIFFHGWRRKLGVVTLVIAFAFTGGWMRSPVVTDVLLIPTKSGLPPRFYDRAPSENENDMTLGLWSCHGSFAIEYALDSVVSDVVVDSVQDWYLNDLGFYHPHLSELKQCEGTWRWRCGASASSNREIGRCTPHSGSHPIGQLPLRPLCFQHCSCFPGQDQRNTNSIATLCRWLRQLCREFG